MAKSNIYVPSRTDEEGFVYHRLTKKAPRKTTLVEGSCACGHEGLQKLPDICGPCRRDRDRDTSKRNAENRARQNKEYSPIRIQNTIKRVMSLTVEERREVLEKVWQAERSPVKVA